ncbi:MAG: glycosyltransferase family 2 protein [Gammaproteobacteria bacterium]|nr:glycosyltransferase family 2 protein [Gammaproteobacteria bacterium]
MSPERYAATPQMSVVLVARDGAASIEQTLSCIAAQSACHRLELLVVVPERHAAATQVAVGARFAGARIVKVPRIESAGRANAAGVRAASAPVVAFAEDHCFPEPGWAERLIEAHRGPWAAVGPAVGNANPGSALSWADFIIGYGPWMLPAESREMDFLPGHNSSYKRDVLLGYGERLEELIESETVLHWDLVARGERLYREAGARTWHTNFSLPGPWLKAHYHNGRLFAGVRAEGMTTLKRLVYVLGSPLIPLVRLARTVRANARALREHPACLPALVAGLAVDAAGQFAGYLLGTGDAVASAARYEFDRFEHVRPEDRPEKTGQPR